MRRRFGFASLPRMLSTLLTLGAGVATLAGCGSDDAHHVDSGGPDFSVCLDTAGVMYAPGIFVTSRLGAYRVTLVSAVTEGSPPVESPQIGDGTWEVSVTDATAGTPAEVTMTSERPWMPKHNHGAPDYPVVTPGEPGRYTISKIDFFMAGYWQLKLNLVPVSGDPDDATFSICVPQ
jgi:YtkA-like